MSAGPAAPREARRDGTVSIASELDAVVPPSIPRRGAPRLTAIGRWLLRAWRWRVEGRLPDVPRLVVVVAPHTSNWDFPVGVLVMLALDLDPRWLGKHTLFRPPLGGALRRIGGIPIRKDERHGVVEQVLAELRGAERMLLALAPEGTRRKVATWKSGYYAIAEGAGVPIVPASFDWSRRVVAFGAPVDAVGGAEATTARLRGLLRPEMARRADRY